MFVKEVFVYRYMCVWVCICEERSVKEVCVCERDLCERLCERSMCVWVCV